MSSETINVKFDLVKLVIAAFVVIAAIVSFYIFDDQSTPLRVAGLLVAVGVCCLDRIADGTGQKPVEFFAGCPG